MWRSVSSLLLLIVLFAGTQGQKINKTIIDDVFNTPVGPKGPNTAQLIPGVNCDCVQYYLCNNDSTINNNGMGIIDIRADENPCSTYMEFCCFPNQTTTNPVTPVPPIKRKGCGSRNVDGVGFRITGDTDNESQFGELPWMTAILGEELVNGTENVLDVYKCGGALIHPQVVLTAAHCVQNNIKQLKIRAGEWDTQNVVELYPYQDQYVKTVIIHPKFFAPPVFNDVALLILESPVELTANVDVICLPPQDFVVPAGTRCLASGWGKDEFGQEGKYQVILKRIGLPIVERNDCQDRFRTTRLGKHFQLDPSFICAGGEKGRDTCKGDGGSPLVCPIPGRPEQYQQAGIVAWGIGCGEDKIPAAYANVAMFRDWIDEQMKLQNLDITLYQY